MASSKYNMLQMYDMYMKCSIYHLYQTLKFCTLNFFVGFFVFGLKENSPSNPKGQLDWLKSFILKGRV